MTGGTVDWLFFDLNSFFASCEQQDDPALRGKPIGILPSLVETTCCIAASYAAKAFQVKTGTMVREARKRCPEIKFIAARPRRYVEFHNRIIAAAEKVVHIDQIRSIDEFACRLMGAEREVGRAIEIAQRMKEIVRREVGDCLTASIGLAPTQFLAKVASDMQKPDGLTVLTEDVLQARLTALDLEDMPGIGPRMRARLELVGIHTMADLWAADRRWLKSIWGGIEGERFYDQLHGIEPYRPATQTRVVGHQHVLAPDDRTPSGLRSWSQHLLIKAAERLRGKGYRCQRLLLVVDWARPHGSNASALRFKPTHETQQLLCLLNEELLPAVMARKLKPWRVGVQLDELVPADKEQLDLFASRRPQALDAAVDRINDRFGRDAVFYGGTIETKKHYNTRISFTRVPTLDEY